MNERSDTADPLVQRLRTLAEDSPSLNDAARIYEAILPVLRDADLRVAPIIMTREEARSKMGKGLPLLHDLDLELDVVEVRQLMLELACAVETAGEKGGPHKRRLYWGRVSHEPDAAARRLRLALEENSLDIGNFLPDIAAGESGPIASAARDLQLDSGLVWTLAQNALKPAMRAWCRQLAPLAAGIPWHSGACFICGAVAVLGELQENDQVKHLRCGACGSDWRFQRLQCMYCGNEDHTTQRCFYTEVGCEKMRVEVCDKCRGYLKVISSFAPTSPEMLPAEDLATLRLDYIAQGHGYSRANVMRGAGADRPAGA